MGEALSPKTSVCIPLTLSSGPSGMMLFIRKKKYKSNTVYGWCHKTKDNFYIAIVINVIVPLELHNSYFGNTLLYKAEQCLVNVLLYSILDSFKPLVIVFAWQWFKDNHQSLSAKHITLKSVFNVWPILKVSPSDLWCGKQNKFYYACFLSASHSTTITTSLCDVRGD